MKLNYFLLLVMFFLSSIYISIDRYLFFFGKNDLNIYNSLPFNLKPTFRQEFEGGFAIEDNYGFFLISRGKHKYVGTGDEVYIEKFIKYGINKSSFIAQVTNKRGENYYIVFTENDIKQSKQDILINVVDSEIVINETNYNWFNLEELQNKVLVYERIHNYTLLVLLLLFLFWMYRIIRQSANNKRQPR